MKKELPKQEATSMLGCSVEDVKNALTQLTSSSKTQIVTVEGILSKVELCYRGQTLVIFDTVYPKDVIKISTVIAAIVNPPEMRTFTLKYHNDVEENIFIVIQQWLQEEINEVAYAKDESMIREELTDLAGLVYLLILYSSRSVVFQIHTSLSLVPLETKLRFLEHITNYTPSKRMTKIVSVLQWPIWKMVRSKLLGGIESTIKLDWSTLVSQIYILLSDSECIAIQRVCEKLAQGERALKFEDFTIK